MIQRDGGHGAATQMQFIGGDPAGSGCVADRLNGIGVFGGACLAQTDGDSRGSSGDKPCGFHSGLGFKSGNRESAQGRNEVCGLFFVDMHT